MTVFIEEKTDIKASYKKSLSPSLYPSNEISYALLTQSTSTMNEKKQAKQHGMATHMKTSKCRRNVSFVIIYPGDLHQDGEGWFNTDIQI